MLEFFDIMSWEHFVGAYIQKWPLFTKKKKKELYMLLWQIKMFAYKTIRVTQLF